MEQMTDRITEVKKSFEQHKVELKWILECLKERKDHNICRINCETLYRWIHSELNSITFRGIKQSKPHGTLSTHMRNQNQRSMEQFVSTDSNIRATVSSMHQKGSFL